MSDKIRVKKIEKAKLNNKDHAYLIYRYYPVLVLQEYIVCINYHFKNNTYKDGYILPDLVKAYQLFNKLVNCKNFDFIKMNKQNIDNLPESD